MNLLLALILGAEPAPAFDVPIREVSLGMFGDDLFGLLHITPGECEIWAPGRTESVVVTARLSAMQAEDVRSLLMVGLDTGYSPSSWGTGDLERPPGPSVSARVTALSPEIHDPTFGWTTVLVPTPSGRLTEAWRLYGLFSLCNLGEAVDVWVALMDAPKKERHLALAVATEWMLWANREEDFVYAMPGLVKDCRAGRCEALPDALRRASRSWADSPSPRSFAPLERSPPVETAVSP